MKKINYMADCRPFEERFFCGYHKYLIISIIDNLIFLNFKNILSKDNFYRIKEILRNIKILIKSYKNEM